MPPQKQPCYCTKCNGALMSTKAIARHRIAEPPNTQIPTFDEWTAQRGGLGPEERDFIGQSEADGDEDGEAGEEDRDEPLGPRKRRRIDDAPPPDISNEILETRSLSLNVPDRPDHVLPQDTVREMQENEHEEPPNEPQYDPDVDEEDQDRPISLDGSEETEDVHPGQGGPALARTPEPDIVGDDPEAHAQADPVFSRIEHLRFAQEFIAEVSRATLDNGGLDDVIIDYLRHPEEAPVDISDPDTRYSLALFLSCKNASEQTYIDFRDATLIRYPDSNILSYHKVKELVAKITGVRSFNDDMCINGCHAFTGPFADLEACRVCFEPRYNPEEFASSGKKVPRQQASTILLGPQLQARRRSPLESHAIKYRDRKVAEIIEAFNAANSSDELVYDDTFCGNDILDHCETLTEDDMTVVFSIDGAQLYQDKKSDTWIAIWILMDYDPTTRYKKRYFLPALIIPGPHKPKHLDSYLFRSFHHLSALQKENNGAGLSVWDAEKERVVTSRISLLGGLADAMGLVELDGRVGHHGAQGCRIGCEMTGMHKPNSGHYYAVHLSPNGANPGAPIRRDFDFQSPSVGSKRESPQIYAEKIARLIASRDQNDYEQTRKATGLSKPSIISGLEKTLTIPVPLCFSLDLMHLILNISDLLLSHWRGMMKFDATTDSKLTWDWAALTGNTWIQHGKLVAAATKYFPASFHRPPRNPAEKISSGYKATEWYLYVFGLGPGFFRTVLPRQYWRNFCKLVHAFRGIIQRRITGKQVRECHSFFTQFVEEYELLYYQRRMDRIHYCRPCIHTLLHICPEIIRTGPGAYITQFPLERAIGDLGKSIRQPATPFANLAQIALRQAQVNALKTMCPELDKSSIPSIPRLSFDLGHGSIMLRPRDRYAKNLQGAQKTAVTSAVNLSALRKWGRLRLPNGQVARSVYSESRRTAPNKRNTRNVKIKFEGEIAFAEVQFYFLVENDAEGKLDAYALVSVYGPPDADMLEDSYHTLWACAYSGDDNLEVIPVSVIISLVSMQPLPSKAGDPENLWFVVEKSGLDDIEITGYVDEL